MTQLADTKPELTATILRDLMNEALTQGVTLSRLELDGMNIQVPDDFGERGATWVELIVHRLVLMAAQGDMKAVTEVLDRILGKSAQHQTLDVNHNSYTEYLVKLEADLAPALPPHPIPLAIEASAIVVEPEGVLS